METSSRSRIPTVAVVIVVIDKSWKHSIGRHKHEWSMHSLGSLSHVKLTPRPATNLSSSVSKVAKLRHGEHLWRFLKITCPYVLTLWCGAVVPANYDRFSPQHNSNQCHYHIKHTDWCIFEIQRVILFPHMTEYSSAPVCVIISPKKWIILVGDRGCASSLHKSHVLFFWCRLMIGVNATWDVLLRNQLPNVMAYSRKY